MPIASVIIPTYNAKFFLIEAIGSVLSQSMPDFELLVIDDGSTDGTHEAVKAINDLRIRYFYKENGGVSSARNVGIRNAKGRYITFLDCDDLFHPNYLNMMIDILERNPDYGVAYTGIIEIRTDGTMREKIKNTASGWIAEELFGSFFGLYQIGIVRGSLAKNLYFDESLRIAEDLDYALKLSILTRFIYVPGPQMIRRIQKESHSRQNGVGKIHGLNIEVYERFYYELGGNRFVTKQKALSYIAKQYQRLAAKHFKSRLYDDALHLYLKSLHYKKNSRSAILGLVRCLISVSFCKIYSFLKFKKPYSS